MTVAITGPTTLFPGQTGTYTITASRSDPTAATYNGARMGVDIAASDAGSLAVVTANDGLKTLTDEIVHDTTAGALHTFGDRKKHFAFDSTECEIPSLALLSHAR